MKTMIGHDRNEALSEVLMEMMIRLREFPSRGFEGRIGQVLSRGAEQFDVRFAGHLRSAEGILFPALRELEPGAACDLDSLERDHRFLQLRARDLALQIRDMDKEEAYGLTRSVLAALLDHLHREAEDVDRFVQSLDLSDARRLTRSLVERHLSGEEADGFPDPRRPH